jgi:hypothetical protein
VRIVDFETGEYLPGHVGRCDREHGCGNEYTWYQWLREKGRVHAKPFIELREVQQNKSRDFLPLVLVEKSLKNYNENNLYKYLATLFTKNGADELCRKYLIGTSKYWRGAHVFWQIDEESNVRQVKLMLSEPLNGKRMKEGATVERYDKVSKTYYQEITDRPCSMVYGKFLTEDTKKLNLEQTFFGCHLLTKYPNKPVYIVESEKTALIASFYMPQFVWLATGGASGCKWREYSIYKVLQGRSVTWFPDYGYFNIKSGKTCFEEWTERVARIQEAIPGRFRVSSKIEEKLQHKGREDQDLENILVTQDIPTGLALVDNAYPVVFDNHQIKCFGS